MSETKKCPYCAEEVLIEAKKCKHCGEYLDAELKSQKEVKSQPQEITVENKEGCFLQTMNLGCMIIFGTIVILAIILIILGLQY